MEFTLGLSVVLVMMVIYFFLRSAPATLIPAIALPISLIGTFAGMWLLDLSIDNISLLALTLCVGFVVDDAIVMLENIVRHVENGERRLRGRAQGLARDRLHDHVDDLVADRRVHPDHVHGWRRRPPLLASSAT